MFRFITLLRLMFICYDKGDLQSTSLSNLPPPFQQRPLDFRIHRLLAHVDVIERLGKDLCIRLTADESVVFKNVQGTIGSVERIHAVFVANLGALDDGFDFLHHWLHLVKLPAQRFLHAVHDTFAHQSGSGQWRGDNHAETSFYRGMYGIFIPGDGLRGIKGHDIDIHEKLGALGSAIQPERLAVQFYGLRDVETVDVH